MRRIQLVPMIVAAAAGLWACSKSEPTTKRKAPAKAGDATPTDALVGANALKVDSRDALPACDGTKIGQLAYVTGESLVVVCDGSAWSGLGGGGGDAKLASATTPEPAGENCRYGGNKVESGLDADGDGKLGAAEATSSLYLCSGTIDDVARGVFSTYAHSIGMVIIEVDAPNCDTEDPNDTVRVPASGGTGWLVGDTVVATNAHVVDPIPAYYLDCPTAGDDAPTQPEVDPDPGSGPGAPDDGLAKRSAAIMAKLQRGPGELKAPAKLATKLDDGDGDVATDGGNAKMYVKVFLPKTTIAADQILRQGLPHFGGFLPSTDDFDVIESAEVDRSSVEGDHPSDLAFVKIAKQTRKPLTVSAKKTSDAAAGTLRAADEVFHIGYDQLVGPRLAAATVHQIQRCEDWLSPTKVMKEELRPTCKSDLRTGEDQKVVFFFGYGDHGGSGSPIFDRFGEVTGILTWGSDYGSETHYVAGQVAEDLQRHLARARVWKNPND